MCISRHKFSQCGYIEADDRQQQIYFINSFRGVRSSVQNVHIHVNEMIVDSITAVAVGCNYLYWSYNNARDQHIIRQVKFDGSGETDICFSK